MEAADPLTSARAALIADLRDALEGREYLTRAEVEVGLGYPAIASAEAAANTLNALISSGLEMLGSAPRGLPAPANLDLGEVLGAGSELAALLAGTRATQLPAAAVVLQWLPAAGPVLGIQARHAMELIQGLSHAVHRLAQALVPVIMVDDRHLLELLWPMMTAVSQASASLAVYVYGPGWLRLLDPTTPQLFRVEDEAAFVESHDDTQVRLDYERRISRILGRA